MEKFFRTSAKPSLSEGALSKRVEKAVKLLGRDHSASDSDLDVDEQAPKPKRTRKTKSDKVLKAEKSNNQPTTSQSKEKPSESSIKQKLHCERKIPQKESTQKVLEDRKKRAIEIFKTGNKKSLNKKRKVIVEKEVKLSESSSDD